jgi:hypothetical protein
MVIIGLLEVVLVCQLYLQVIIDYFKTYYHLILSNFILHYLYIYILLFKGVTVGHIVDESRDLRIQVMDTPGLLDRPPEDRNEMEKLTFASLVCIFCPFNF